MSTSISTDGAALVPFELSALAEAHLYQRWLMEQVEPYLGRRILELGSGIGNLSQHLPVRERLVLSDVEPAFISHLQSRFGGTAGTDVVRFEPGGPPPASLAEENLDTVVSFNVMEHVEDDAALLRDMISLLRNSRSPGPRRIVTMAPAMNWAFGSLDREYGHFRRYSLSSYRRALQRAGAKVEPGNFHGRYMNTVGLAGWILNGLILKKREIDKASIQAFERLIPLLKPLDNFLCGTLRFPLGNSLVAVYEING